MEVGGSPAEGAAERLQVRGRRLSGFSGPWLVVHFVPLLHSHLVYADVKQKLKDPMKVFWLPERVRSAALSVTWHQLRYLDRPQRPCTATAGRRHCLERARLRAAAAAAGCLPHFVTVLGDAEAALPDCSSPETYRRFVAQFQRPVTDGCPRACHQLIPAIARLTTRDPGGTQASQKVSTQVDRTALPSDTTVGLPQSRHSSAVQNVIVVQNRS